MPGIADHGARTTSPCGGEGASDVIASAESLSCATASSIQLKKDEDDSARQLELDGDKWCVIYDTLGLTRHRLGEVNQVTVRCIGPLKFTR